MTTFFLAILVIASIGLIARYNKDASLFSNMLLVFAFSVAVGLGIQFTTCKKEVKKITKIEKIVNTNSVPMQSTLALEPNVISLPGAVSYEQNWIVAMTIGDPLRLPIDTTFNYRCGPYILDTS